MNPPLQASLIFFSSLHPHGPDKGIIDWQSSEVVGFSGTAQAWDCKGDQHSERRASLGRSTPAQAARFSLFFLQLELSGRRHPSGRWTTAVSNAPVRDTDACIFDHMNSGLPSQNRSRTAGGIAVTKPILLCNAKTAWGDSLCPIVYSRLFNTCIADRHFGTHPRSRILDRTK